MSASITSAQSIMSLTAAQAKTNYLDRWKNPNPKEFFKVFLDFTTDVWYNAHDPNFKVFLQRVSRGKKDRYSFGNINIILKFSVVSGEICRRL